MRADKAVSLLGTSYYKLDHPGYWPPYFTPPPISLMAHKVVRHSLPSWQNKKHVSCHPCGKIAMESTSSMTRALRATVRVCRTFGKRESWQPHQPSQKGTLPGLLHIWQVSVQTSCQNGFVPLLCPSLSKDKMCVSAFSITDSLGCFPPPLQETSARWQCW